MCWSGMGLFSSLTVRSANPRNAKNRENLMTYLHDLSKDWHTMEFAADFALIDDPDYKFVIARKGSQGPIIAYCCFHMQDATAEVLELYATIKNKGYGAKVLKVTEQLARSWGARSIHLTAVAKATKFYRAQGYVSNDDIDFIKAL